MSEFSRKIGLLLNHLNKNDESQLSDSEFAEVANDAYSTFFEASKDLPALLLDQVTNDPGWLWLVEKSEYGYHFIGSFQMMRTTGMEAAAGAPQKVQMAAAIFPEVSLKVGLFGAYHHPGGSGLQTDAHVLVSVEVSDNIALILAGDGIATLAPDIEDLVPRGVKVRVAAHEGTESSEDNPADLSAAFLKVVEEARKAAQSEDPECGIDDPALLVETISLELEISASVDDSTIDETLSAAGILFQAIAKAMDRLYVSRR